MGETNQEYNGELISDLGVNLYLKAMKDRQFSNVDMLYRPGNAPKNWKPCNFSCHGTPYRVLKRQSSYAEMLKPIDDFSPMLAGVVDGVHHQTLGKAEKIGRGLKRTAEGLMITGEENFNNVADENYAVYEFAKSALEKMVSFDLSVLDNPIMQSVMTIVKEYVIVLPEWVIEEAFRQGAFEFPEKIDTAWLMKASALGLIKEVGVEDLKKAAEFLNNPAQRIVGKMIGKKLAVAIAVAIAGCITKKIIAQHPQSGLVRRRLASLRKSARSAKGGLGSALLILLQAQGFLDAAGESSRRLNQTSPRLWNTLRFQLNGANMVYFLVEPMVQEYVDRIALLERNPIEFFKVMKALVKDKQTPQIFFPNFVSFKG